MEINFKGKRAIVTGAGKGIGRATAVRLTELGANVIAISRTQEDLDSLKKEMPSIEICLLDIANWTNTRNVVEKMGHVDLLVNNAAVIYWATFLEVTKDELYNEHDINFKAAFNISQVVARGMVSSGSGGAIVNVSSVSGQRGVRDHPSYCTSKAALDMLTSTMALELGKHQIRVNSVNPTLVLTPMVERAMKEGKLRADIIQLIPLGRTAEKKDVVDTIVYLLSDRAAMVTGSVIPVDGGMLTGFM